MSPTMGSTFACGKLFVEDLPFPEQPLPHVVVERSMHSLAMQVFPPSDRDARPCLHGDC